MFGRMMTISRADPFRTLFMPNSDDFDSQLSESEVEELINMMTEDPDELNDGEEL